MKHIGDKLESEKYAKQKKWRMKQKKQGKALKQLYLSASEAEYISKLMKTIRTKGLPLSKEENIIEKIKGKVKKK